MSVGIRGRGPVWTVALGTSGRGDRTFGRFGVDVDALGLRTLGERFCCCCCGVEGNPPGPRRGVSFIAPVGSGEVCCVLSWVGQKQRQRYMGVWTQNVDLYSLVGYKTKLNKRVDARGFLARADWL
jgi:hypothetical protein